MLLFRKVYSLETQHTDITNIFMQNSTSTILQPEVLQLKGSLFTITVLHLFDADLDHVKKELMLLIKHAPKLFDHSPIIIDLQELKTAAVEINLLALKTVLRQLGLMPIGVRGGTTELQAAAIAAELAIFPLMKPHSETIESLAQMKNNGETSKKNAVQKAITTKVITKPVRSGQQIYAQNSDLIVLSTVSQGAELLADGNIHIYGALRGRALAGTNGNEEARIFCQSLEAELVAIAGRYVMNGPANQLIQRSPQQIFLEDNKLRIVPL